VTQIPADSTPPVPPTPNPAPAGAPSSDEKTWALFAHLAALAGFVGIPFGNIIGPLVIWLIKKDQMPFVNNQAKESLNFQITVMIAVIICIPLIFVCVGIPLLIAVGVGNLVLIIMGAIKANSGVAYRYPLCLRLIK
jgi:uncharacterized protein